jgi:hypothetical protein
MNRDISRSGSLLAIEVGSTNTYAALFDIVSECYRHIKTGTSRTSLGNIANNLMLGVISAIEDLEELSGQVLLDGDRQLLKRGGRIGPGVEQCVATISAGPPLKVLLVGLLDEVSIVSARQLARATQIGDLKILNLKNRGKTEQVIDEVLRYGADLIIAAGGTDNGAEGSLLSLLEPVGMAVSLMDETCRPEILYVGNQAIQPAVASIFTNGPFLHFAPNIRPTIDQGRVETGYAQLGEITVKIRCRQLAGAETLLQWAEGHLVHTPHAFGRIVRYFSQAYQTGKGVLGVAIGAGLLTTAAALDGRLSIGLSTYPWPGEQSVLQPETVLELQRMVMMPEISAPQIESALYQKAHAPDSLPFTHEELEIEHASLRVGLWQAMQALSGSMPAGIPGSAPGHLPWFEPILVSGEICNDTASLAQACLLLLDGLQPCGVSTLVLDQDNLMPALGAAAEINPTLAVQVIDSDAFLHLATVITPVGDAPSGTPVLRIRMTYQDGRETTLDVKQGTLEVLPLAAGQTGRLHLQPFHRYEVGMGGARRGGGFRVTGSALGVVIDARGRPLKFSDDPYRRHELFKKWLWTLGD